MQVFLPLPGRTADLLRDFAPDDGAWTIPARLARRAADELEQLEAVVKVLSKEIEELRNASS